MSPRAGSVTRRFFLQAGFSAAAGLVIGCRMEPPASPRSGRGAPEPASGAPPAPVPAGPPLVANPWIRIAPDGTVTIVIDKSEMGQGIETGLAMLAAEELEVELSRVRTEFAPADAVYKNKIFGSQATGGSTSVRAGYDSMRKAGAAARIMLVTAAAKAWGVDPGACRADKGKVVHPPTGRRTPYAALLAQAAEVPVPQDPPLKPASEHRLLGTRPTRVDALDKAKGRAGYGIDVRRPGLLTAVVVRSPVFGGKLTSFNGDKASRIKGVRKVLQIDSGVAVVADHFWAARKGAEALEIQWDDGNNEKISSDTIVKAAAAMAKKPGKVAEHEGDVARALRRAAKRIEATYEVPYQAHAAMEPLSCTVEIGRDACDVWAPTQGQGAVQAIAARMVGLPQASVRVHTTYLGGAFGRKFEMDFVIEAIQLAKAMAAPVKVVWSREDDMRHDFYRPASYHALRGALGRDGMPVAWSHRIVCGSIMSRVFPKNVKGGIDHSSIEGAIEQPYAIPNRKVELTQHDTGIPIGFWRSVGSSQNAFVKECFLDELAALAGQDPYEYRRKLLANAPRWKGVLELAATKAGWGTPLAKGKGRGIAVHFSFGTYVAHVAEVTVDKDGSVKVDRVVCAVDCGSVVHPGMVETQMEGAIVYGLCATLKGEITIEAGRVKQANFHNFKLLRMNEMPKVDVHIVPSTEKPGGVGEPGTPPIAPAVTNAIFAATGKRIRKLPVKAADLKQG